MNVCFFNFVFIVLHFKPAFLKQTGQMLLKSNIEVDFENQSCIQLKLNNETVGPGNFVLTLWLKILREKKHFTWNTFLGLVKKIDNMYTRYMYTGWLLKTRYFYNKFQMGDSTFVLTNIVKIWNLICRNRPAFSNLVDNMKIYYRNSWILDFFGFKIQF